MSSVIDLFQSALHTVIGYLLQIFAFLGSTTVLTLISILLGILMVFCYQKVSFQTRIRTTKKNIHGAMLESVLFRHDLRTSMLAQGKMFMLGVRYVLLAVPPIVVLAIPTIFILAELNIWFDARAISSGENVVIRAETTTAQSLNAVTLSSDTGIEITPALKVPRTQEIFWRVTPTVEGSIPLTLKIDSTEFEVPLNVGKATLQPLLGAVESSWWRRILSPSFSLKAPAGLRSLHIQYPTESYSLFGLETNWIVFFFIVSLLSGFVGSWLFGVEV